MQACDRCHARKTRCDRRIPRCGACEKAGTPCLHVDKLRHRNLPRGYVESVESQLRKAEDENLQLQREVAALRSQLSDSGSRNNDHPTQSQNNEAANSNDWNNHSAEPPAQDGDATGERSTHSGRTPADEAVANEVGYLSLKATGETRYLGSSSGLTLASIISTILGPQNSASIWPTDAREPDGRSTQLTPANPADAPFPPQHLAMQFIEAYFQHTHITFPLLHRPTFLQAVEQIYSDPTYYPTYTFDAFAFDMVLAIGSSNFNRFEESNAGTATHYARAQAKIHTVLSMGGLVPLRAILLLSQHGIFSNLRDTSASIWHLIGIGARICFELGLHLEPKRLDRGAVRAPSSTAPITLEAEMRKRCFWCFYNLDRVVSFTLGRPVALRDEDIDVSLPSHLDDECFGPDRPIQPETSSLSPSPKISPFLHLIRIRRLSGKILGILYAANQRTDVSLEEKKRVRRQLHEEIVAWRDDTRLLNLSDGPHDNRAYISSFLSPEWYTAVFNNAMLLLYRPSPYLPHPITPTRVGIEQGDLQQLFTAAKSSITAYYELHRKRRLNYSWITLHGVFIAGLAYVYGIGRALKDSDQAMPIPDYLDIINDTRACSNVLVAICERWNVARSSCELFNRLSNAVIRDAVNAAAKREMASSQEGYNLVHTTRDLEPSLTSDNRPTPLQNVQQSHRQDSLPTAGALGQFEQVDHVFVVDEFRQYSSGFESPFLGNQLLPSELVMGFSQDWPFDDAPFAEQQDYSVPMQGVNVLW